MPLNSPRSSIKNKKLRRRQTIDTVQSRHHRTTLQQIQAMLWPTRQAQTTTTTISNNNQINKHEAMPMIAEKPTNQLQRSLSVRENNPNTINENFNERRKSHRIQRHSDTMANI
ncbi:unnamed protein product [Adineta steineri]|uniref:Uncharacterized protein n=1 Tax=Adineta steineri TaxID=433720 RepID=A0A813UL25_9BILA|nr:unnamed protein product [Adineta steineri]CAF1009024.1 unnamed protein product [Adineta steineri]CAF1018300.1 unnamed protein product [Adineta steineri]